MDVWVSPYKKTPIMLGPTIAATTEQKTQSLEPKIFIMHFSEEEQTQEEDSTQTFYWRVKKPKTVTQKGQL